MPVEHAASSELANRQAIGIGSTPATGDRRAAAAERTPDTRGGGTLAV